MKIKSLLKRNYNHQPLIDYPDYKSSLLRAPKQEKIFFVQLLQKFLALFLIEILLEKR